MSTFITLKKKDSAFKNYLLGTFSKTQLAMPMSTMNLDSPEETVTFEIVEKSSIKRPSVFSTFFALIKFQNLFLILLPLFYVLVKNYVDNRFRDPGTCMIASLGMLFIFAALNIRNDVNDHMSGYDRVNITHTAKPINKGWITADSASNISWILTMIATLIAVPVMYRQPEEARVIAVVTVLIFAGRLLSKNSYKNQRWGEVIFFILAGPGVISGYQVALGAGVDTEGLAFGVLWAWGIQFLVHLNNFSHILTSSQAGIKNTMTNAGFDKAKKILIGWWCAFIVLWVLYHYFYASTFWSYLTTAILIFWSIPTFIKISETSSPLGSDLAEAKQVGYRTFLLMCVLIVIEFYWYLGNKNDWFI
ncbi:hypothetical protein CIK05_02750 [Bdellovibrio sp. qaytius]|nr:hypothetical protein CIK05_02750 [Bdellovibrio sp. qaytius]